MPCDRITYQSVELGKVRPDLLAAAWKDIGATNVSGNSATYLGVRYTVRGSRLGSTDYDADLETVRLALLKGYAKRALGAAAKAWGWQPKKVAENQFVLRR